MNPGLSTVARFAATTALILVFAVAGTRGQMKEPTARRGGPQDWSHGRLLASDFGPDGGRNINKDWRTQRKHARLERMRALRESKAKVDLWDMLKPPKEKKAEGQVAPHLDWNLRTGGYGYVAGFPAKYNFDIEAANCSDVIYFTVNQNGAASTVNVIAITNPYVGCPGNPANATPTVKFGLRLPYGVPTSPVPSLDGEVLYVIESRPSANGGFILHAINVDNITTSPGTYDYGTTNWSNAHTLVTTPTGPLSEQLFEITYAGRTNTTSSPFLDYATNNLYFGDSGGRVYRVLNANTAAAANDPLFPVQCGTSALTSTVFAYGQVIVGSANGRIYRIDTTLPPPYTCIASALVGTGASVGGGLSDPIVDLSNNKIIVVTNDMTGYNVRVLLVFDLMFAAGATYTSGGYLGPRSTSINPMSPAFDDLFWSTNNGNIYAVGAPDAGNGTYLMRLPYNGTADSFPAGFATLYRSGGAGVVYTTPVTEFLTASSAANPDFIFVGGATGNYKYLNRISSGFAGTNATPVAMDGTFQPVGAGGIYSGIIIDTNTTATTGTTATANVYFGTVGVASSLQSYIVQLAQEF